MLHQPDAPATLSNLLIAKGYLGVDLFFLLSGFILMHVYQDSILEGRFVHRDFLLKRFARVYPLHFLATAVFLVMYVSADLAGLTRAAEGMNWTHLPWHALAMHAWGTTDGHSWNFPSWSISAEAFAYLLFPVFVAVAGLARPVTALACALVAFAAAYAVALHFGHVLTTLTYDLGILRITFEFLIGITMYRVFRQVRVPHARVVASSVGLAIIAGVCLGASDLVFVPLLALLVFSLACSACEDGRWLMSRPEVVYLGEISYSTYMVHWLVLLIMENVPFAPEVGSAPHVAITLSVIYALSALSFHLLEQPMRGKIQRLAHGRMRLERGKGGATA